MAASINRTLLVGNLTKDPVARQTPSGLTVAELSIAVNGREKRNGQWEDRVDFFDVTVFGAQAENCARFLSKGRPVAIDGKLRQERWQDRDSGANRSKVKIVADAVQFLGSNGGTSSAPSESPAPDYVPVGQAGTPGATFNDDDIPF